MPVASLVAVRFGAIGRRWRAFARWQKFGIGLVLAILAGYGAFSFQQWWTSWPARVVLKREGDHHPMAFSPDGSVVATISARTGVIEIWDAANGEKRATWQNADHRNRYFGRFSQDGATFTCTMSTDSLNPNYSIDMIDVATGLSRGRIDSPLPNSGLGQCFLHDGKTLRLFADDGTTREVIDVDIATAKVVGRHPLTYPIAIIAGNSSLDGRRYAFLPRGAGAVTPVTIWDLDTDREECKLPVLSAGGSILRMEFSSDRKTLALGRTDGSIELWDLTTRTLRSTLRAHSRNYWSLQMRFSPDGSMLVSLGRYHSPDLSIENLRMKLAEVTRDQNHYLITETIVIDTVTGRRLVHSSLEGPTIFSPDGKTLATSHDDGTVRIHDVPKRR
jgi:WD40 repeat protein